MKEKPIQKRTLEMSVFNVSSFLVSNIRNPNVPDLLRKYVVFCVNNKGDPY